MSMTEKHHVHIEVINRLGEAGRAEERKYLRGLAHNCRRNRRVMQNHDEFLRSKAVQCDLEPQRLVDRFGDEVLDRILAEWRQHVFVESTAKPLRPRKS